MLGTFSGSGLGFGLAFTLVNNFSSPARQIEKDMMMLDAGAFKLASGIQRSMSMVQTGITMALGAFIGLNLFVKSAKLDAEFQKYQTTFQIFTGSAVKARGMFNDIVKDAIKNPFFSIQDLLKGNAMLVSQGVAAEQSMRLVRNLSTVIASVGGGSAELNRTLIALEKMKAKGVLDGRTLLSFAHARLPFQEIMTSAFGKPFDQLKKAGITIEMIDKAFQHATSSAGRFGGVAGLLFNTIYAKAQQVNEQWQLFLSRIGEAIRPMTGRILELASGLLQQLTNFLQTPFGQWAARAALGATLLWGALGLLLIIGGLNTIMFSRFANMLGVVNKTQVMATLSSKGLTAAWWQMFTIMIRSIPSMVASLTPFIAAATVLYTVSRSLQEFKDVMEGIRTPQAGFIGFLQRVGGLLKTVLTAFTSYDTNKHQFIVSADFMNAIDSLGIGETARAIFTWVARIIELFHGFVQGVQEGWFYIKAFFTGFLNMLGISDDWLTRLTGNLTTFAQIGQWLGRILMTMAFAWIIIKGLSLIQWAVQMITSTVMLTYKTLLFVASLELEATAWIAVNAEMLVFMATGIAAIAVIGLIAYGIYQFAMQSSDAFTGVRKDVEGFNTALNDFSNNMGVAGGLNGYGFRQGWDNALEQWNPFKPIMDKWETFKQWMSDHIKFMTPLSTDYLGDNAAFVNKINTRIYGKEDYSKPGSLEALYAGNRNRNFDKVTTNDFSGANLGKGVTAPAAPTIIHNHIHIDGREVADSVVQIMTNNHATNHE